MQHETPTVHATEGKSSGKSSHVSSILVSVIIPARNASRTIDLCLQSVRASTHRNLEVIVVDDGSEDDTSCKARRFGCRIISNPVRRGVGVARQQGIETAEGMYLFFTDSDVCIADTAIETGLECLLQHQDIAAVVGSYTDESGAQNFVSRYKQLLLHHMHQRAPRYCSILTGCCSMVRREPLEHVGGFATSGRFSQILEDAELGFRLCSANYHIMTLPNMQAVHYKHYSFWGLLRSVLRYRAIPWTVLILTYGKVHFGIFAQVKSILSVVLLYLSVVGLVLVTVWPPAICLVPLAGLQVMLDIPLYVQCARKLGVLSLLPVLGLQWLFYFLSGIGLVLGVGLFLCERNCTVRR